MVSIILINGNHGNYFLGFQTLHRCDSDTAAGRNRTARHSLCASPLLLHPYFSPRPIRKLASNERIFWKASPLLAPPERPPRESCSIRRLAESSPSSRSSIDKSASSLACDMESWKLAMIESMLGSIRVKLALIEDKGSDPLKLVPTGHGDANVSIPCRTKCVNAMHECVFRSMVNTHFG
jgi:hypothetical protein